MIDFRTAVITCVLCLSGGGALWLMQTPASMTVAPAQVVAQEFKVAPVETGRVAAILVAPGQRVTGGQAIAKLDTSVLEREIAVGEARLRQIGSETQASAVALASEGYHNERAFQSDVDSATAQLESARATQAQESAELKQTREELQRLSQFLKDGLIRRDRVDELELRLKALENSVSDWPARIDALQSRLHAAKARLADWQVKYSANTASQPRDARVTPVRQRVAEQIEALRVLRTRLETATILAPADGEVVSVTARPGDVVRAGDPFVLVNGTGPRQVIAYVNERESRILQPGHTARLQRRTLSREQYESRVVRVADTVGPVPMRFWASPQLASYGREVVLEIPRNARLDSGEAVDVTFVHGGQS